MELHAGTTTPSHSPAAPTGSGTESPASPAGTGWESVVPQPGSDRSTDPGCWVSESPPGACSWSAGMEPVVPSRTQMFVPSRSQSLQLVQCQPPPLRHASAPCCWQDCVYWETNQSVHLVVVVSTCWGETEKRSQLPVCWQRDWPVQTRHWPGASSEEARCCQPWWTLSRRQHPPADTRPGVCWWWSVWSPSNTPDIAPTPRQRSSSRPPAPCSLPAKLPVTWPNTVPIINSVKYFKLYIHLFFILFFKLIVTFIRRFYSFIIF